MLWLARDFLLNETGGHVSSSHTGDELQMAFIASLGDIGAVSHPFVALFRMGLPALLLIMSVMHAADVLPKILRCLRISRYDIDRFDDATTNNKCDEARRLIAAHANGEVPLDGIM